MASVASQLIEEVTAHAQSDSLEDAREICADGTYFPNNLRMWLFWDRKLGTFVGGIMVICNLKLVITVFNFFSTSVGVFMYACSYFYVNVWDVPTKHM